MNMLDAGGLHRNMKVCQTHQRAMRQRKNARIVIVRRLRRVQRAIHELDGRGIPSVFHQKQGGKNAHRACALNAH